MKRYANDFTVFQEKWNAAKSVRELIGVLGHNENSISCQAYYLRRKGVKLLVRSRGRKNGLSVEEANKVYLERHPEMVGKI